MTKVERFEKIAIIENEVEALCLRTELEERGIPHAIQSHFEFAFDGLFQFSGGWGYVQAPSDRRDEILAILATLRDRAARPGDEEDEPPPDGGGDDLPSP